MLDKVVIRNHRVNFPPGPPSIVIWNLLDALQHLLSDVRPPVWFRPMPVIEMFLRPKIMDH